MEFNLGFKGLIYLNFMMMHGPTNVKFMVQVVVHHQVSLVGRKVCYFQCTMQKYFKKK